ncbi:MAG: hypothetical protein Q7Q71_05595 [Verrucomicrobiota bacterium JB023]|nr:hypothetical protein [Verrucomicrobiota bacterium JB023]
MNVRVNMMMRLLLLLSLPLFVVSCSPSTGWNSPNGPSSTSQSAPGKTLTGQSTTVGQGGGTVTNKPMTVAEIKELRAKRDALAAERDEVQQSSFTTADSTLPTEDLPPLPSVKRQYPYAIPVPGRPGWVYNPETHQPVDVRGVEAGELVYDPRDPANRYPDGTLMPVDEMPNKFRVPRTRVY